MAMAFIRHRVRDYAAWRAVYDAFTDAAVATEGVSLVYRSADDPDDLLVVHPFADDEDIPAWLRDPGRHQAMIAAGVVGDPRIDLSHDHVTMSLRPDDPEQGS
jgi:hypothetical protein